MAIGAKNGGGSTGFLTCAHGTTSGRTVYTYIGGTEVGLTTVDIVESASRGVDAAFVKHTNSGKTTNTSAAGSYTIQYSTSGISYAMLRECGTVAGVTGNKTGRFLGRMDVASWKDVIVTDITSNRPGDSGGLIYTTSTTDSSKKAPAGIIRGDSGLGTYGTRMQAALSALGASLYKSG